MAADERPVLTGHLVTLRPGGADDAAALRAILDEPSVRAWWLEPASLPEIAAALEGDERSLTLVVEIGGEIAGGIQYAEDLLRDELTGPPIRLAGAGGHPG